MLRVLRRTRLQPAATDLVVKLFVQLRIGRFRGPNSTVSRCRYEVRSAKLAESFSDVTVAEPGASHISPRANKIAQEPLTLIVDCSAYSPCG